MNRENNEQPNLNVADIDIVVQAIRLAYDRNAFKIEEAAQISGSLQRLETWLSYCREIQAEAERMKKEQSENPEIVKDPKGNQNSKE